MADDDSPVSLNSTPNADTITAAGSKRKRAKYARRACTLCKMAHAKCSHERPCKRCVSIGRPDECVDAERKKRRRRQKFDGEFFDLTDLIPKIRTLPEWDPNDPRMRPYEEIEEEQALLREVQASEPTEDNMDITDEITVDQHHQDTNSHKQLHVTTEEDITSDDDEDDDDEDCMEDEEYVPNTQETHAPPSISEEADDDDGDSAFEPPAQDDVMPSHEHTVARRRKKRSAALNATSMMNALQAFDSGVDMPSFDEKNAFSDVMDRDVNQNDNGTFFLDGDNSCNGWTPNSSNSMKSSPTNSAATIPAAAASSRSLQQMLQQNGKKNIQQQDVPISSTIGSSDSLKEEDNQQLMQAIEGGNLEQINPELVQQLVFMYMKQREELNQLRSTIGYLQNMIANYMLQPNVSNNATGNSPLPSNHVGGFDSFM